METTIVKKPANLEPPNESPDDPGPQKPFNFYRFGTGIGLLIGAIMGLYLVILEFFVVDPHPAIKFIKYIPFAIIAIWALRRYEKRFLNGNFFKHGILLGGLITIVAAITVIGINIIAYSLSPSLAIDKFTVEVSQISELLLVNGGLFFETMVYGLIITFLGLQAFKN